LKKSAHGFNSEDSVAFRISALGRLRCTARDRKFFREKFISPPLYRAVVDPI
jgi:hypothetical protein